MQIWTTSAFDAMSYQDLVAISAGCGPAKCKVCTRYLNNALGLSLFDACAQHDVDYRTGGSELDRLQSDIRFVCNLLVIALSHPSKINWVRVPYLFGYFAAVRWQGKKHFNYRTANA